MNQYDTNVKIVLDYLSDNSKSQSLYSLSHSCFAQFRKYLEENNLDYSSKITSQWLELPSPRSTKTQKVYKKALARLDDVYQTGHIRFANKLRQSLSNGFLQIISKYLLSVSDKYSNSHLDNIRNRCRFFFSLLQVGRNSSSPDELTYGDILFFYKEAQGLLCKADFSMYKGTVMNLLAWMAAEDLCPIGFSMLLFMARAEKVLLCDDFPQEMSFELKRIGNSCYLDCPPDEFHLASLRFREELEQYSYASTMMSSSKATLDLLYLFLDMNRLGYSSELASIWFCKAADCFGTNCFMARRILGMFDEYIREGALYPDHIFTYKPLLCDQLPTWCREAMESFLEQKRREHMADSTVCMYRSAVTRFCMFLDKEGMTSFKQITADDLKKFNVTDPHATVEGKNAYNVRIRGFLLFLAEEGYIENYFLREALPCACAPKTRIIRILTEEEAQALEHYDIADAALKLRDNAIIQIGLRMGLRGSDITSLELSHIDWESQSICFCQDKTEVGKILPMPTAVGNALYRYLTEGRPASKSKYIFITHKAPYKKVSRSVCQGIMQRAFLSKEEGRPGFHATRRTYATERFHNKCGYSQVADLLGHTTTGTVHKYLSLDEENMRLCPIPLEDAGISMKGGFRNA